MLYKISERTWLDLPKWKCRQEFVDLWNAKHTPKQDIDLIAKLQEQCDRIEAEYKQHLARKKSAYAKKKQALKIC